jgi:hypothetical protein
MSNGTDIRPFQVNMPDEAVASGCVPFVSAAPSLLRLTTTSMRSAIRIMATAMITAERA